MTLNPHLSKADYQRLVTDYATLRGLRWHHETDSRRSKAGFPNLVVAGPGGVAFLELKTNTGRVTPEQAEWIEALRDAGQHALVVRPRHWAGVRDLLDALAATPHRTTNRQEQSA